MAEPARLHPDDIAAIADAVTERLEAGDARDPELVDAVELARRLGRSRGWVYEHADALGAIRVGDGPRPRYQFDPELAGERLREMGRNGRPAPKPAPKPRRRRRWPSEGVELLQARRSAPR